MTAVGEPEVLELGELPEPEISGEHDVRVRLRAAGLNPVDYKLRSSGTVGGSLPTVLGWDGAGVVESVGRGVTRVCPGDDVYFCDGGFGPTPGSYQELKVIDEAFLARMPAPSVFGWREQRERQRAILEQAARHFDAGDLRVAVGATFPLDRAADAHRALEAGNVVGKAVLTME
jgi:NADPH:quinone reductase